MPTWTGWRTNPNLYLANVNLMIAAAEQSFTVAVLPGDTPPSTPFTTEPGRVGAFQVAGIEATAGTAGQRAQSALTSVTYIIDTAFFAVDANRVLDPVDPTSAFPNTVSGVTDPDLAKATSIEYESPHGTLDTTAGLHVIASGAKTVDTPPWTSIDALRLADGTEWGPADYLTDGDVDWQGVALNSARWTAATVVPQTIAGHYLTQFTVDYASLYEGRFAAWQMRAGGGDYAVTPPLNYDIDTFGSNAHGQYRSARYRLLLPAAPLRQYPRDDALGGQPRQDRSSTSVQGSQRQGWAGTYR